MTSERIEPGAEFDGFPYLRLALTRTREDQRTVTFFRETIAQAVRQADELQAESERIEPGAEQARRDDLARDVARLWQAAQTRDLEMPLSLKEGLDRLARVYDFNWDDEDG